jgi:hypothetical protein
MYQIKSTRAGAKIIVNLCVRAIEREGDHLDVGLFHLCTDLIGDQCAVRGHAHAQPLAGTIPGDLEDILAQERLTTRQDHDRLTDFTDVVNQLKGFFCIEITDCGIHVGGTTTMNTVKVAALGRLPGNPFGDIFFFWCHIGNSLENSCLKKRMRFGVIPNHIWTFYNRGVIADNP